MKGKCIMQLDIAYESIKLRLALCSINKLKACH